MREPSPTTSTNWSFSTTPGDARIIELPQVHDPRGNLTFIEGGRHVPFTISRVFYLYDVPGGSLRAGHALKSCHQFIIAVSGSFDVLLDDGCSRQRFQLNRSHYGLVVAPLVWREIDNFSSNSVTRARAASRSRAGSCNARSPSASALKLRHASCTSSSRRTRPSVARSSISWMAPTIRETSLSTEWISVSRARNSASRPSWC